MVLRENECIVGILTLAANDADLRSWSKVASRLRWFRRRYRRKVRSGFGVRSNATRALLANDSYGIRVGGIVGLFSWGNVANAIMIRKVPKAITNTDKRQLYGTAHVYPNRTSAKETYVPSWIFAS